MGTPAGPLVVSSPPPDPGRPEPADPGDTNATRHLSAGAYLDPDFCLSALREVYFQTRRLAAPSYGCDPITVLGHCLRARRAMIVRDVLLVGLLVFLSWLSPVASLLALCALLAVHVAGVAVRVVRDAVAYVIGRDYFRDPRTDRTPQPEGRGRDPATGRPPRRFVQLWFGSVLAQIAARSVPVAGAYVLLLLAMPLAGVLLWHTGPLGPTRLDVSPWAAAGGATILAFLVPTATRVWNRLQLYALRPGRRPQPPLGTRRLSELAAMMRGNTVVYSGFRPFVGSGTLIRNWTLTQRLVRAPHPVSAALAQPTEAEREFADPPFTAHELSEHVRGHLVQLADDPLPERRLAMLTVEDRVFVAGNEISELWPYAPAEFVAHIIANPIAPARHYLQCQVVSWRGELVTTVYVHFAVQGRTLFLELDVLGLAPCDQRYRSIDEVGGVSVRRLLGDALRGALAAPAALPAAPRNLVRVVGDLVILGTSRRHTGRVTRGYDYGAKVSVREMGTSVTTPDPMQRQDLIKYARIIERRVHAAVLDFLEDREVDVTEYRRQSLTIMAGAFATNGGSVTVEGDAVGLQQNVDVADEED